MTHSWCGKFLEVDLSRRTLVERAIPLDKLIEVIGGVGLAAELLYQHVLPRAEPLGPENCLVIAAGPLGGTTWPGSGRLVIAARSPLTGMWGEASMGGYFATQLKRCGYDALLIHGCASEPVILVLQDGRGEIQPASDLWGLETYAAEDSLLTRFPDSEVMTIGPAGERLVPMASLVHHKGNNIAARCGLGAVAGSKMLKAIVARGTLNVAVADQPGFNNLKREAIQLFNKSDFIKVIRMGGGTASATPIAIELDDMSARNWDLVARDWGEKEAYKITGPAMHSLLPTRKDTCYACPVACKWTADGPQIEGSHGHLAGPEYESISGLGSQVLVNDPVQVIQAADLCNRLGIDTISAGATIAWALEAYENGFLPEQYIDRDLELGWGNGRLVIELVRRMAENRPQLGALLAQGTRRAAGIIGAGLEFAIQVKGLELPFHHPRSMRGLEIAYATLPRGATHNEEGVIQDWSDSTYASWVGECIQHMNLSGANNSMVYCQFLSGALNADYTARLLTAVTGIEYTPADLLRAGERAWYLRRAFNLRLGIGLEEETLPKRVQQQIAESHASLKDFKAALAEFHQQRELDARGVPSADKLKTIGLEWLISEFNAG